jgi:hypothetical protein
MTSTSAIWVLISSATWSSVSSSSSPSMTVSSTTVPSACLTLTVLKVATDPSSSSSSLDPVTLVSSVTVVSVEVGVVTFPLDELEVVVDPD